MKLQASHKPTGAAIGRQEIRAILNKAPAPVVAQSRTFGGNNFASSGSKYKGRR